MRNYKNYEVWQNAMHLTNDVYDFCQTFPKSELYGLRSQIQRASVSIACNIAEGSSRSSRKDFKRILEISLGSSYELETLLMVAKMRTYISDDKYDKMMVELSSIQKQLNGLINSLR